MVGELRDPVTTAKTKERLLILPTLRLLVEISFVSLAVKAPFGGLGEDIL
jgi:hypothetical protein